MAIDPNDSDSIPEHMASQPLPPTLKVWQAWPGRHSFFCDGRIMVGPDISVTVFAGLLVTGSCVTFWVFVCTTLPVPAFLVGVLLFGLTMIFLGLTSTTDPGILPSNRGMVQAEIDACAASQRTVEINGATIPLKWCRTCHIFRPPRAAHCAECNVCVERFDHHCPWMGQCIGRRNYRYFLGFVNSCCALCSYTLGLSATAIYHVYLADATHTQGDFLSHALVRTPAGVALVAFCGLILICVGPLACYHCSLVCANKTTSEEIKDTYGHQNPFDLSICHNCSEACCEKNEPPRLRPRALISEPERLDTCGLIDASLRDASQYEPGDTCQGDRGPSPCSGSGSVQGGAAPPVDAPEESPVRYASTRVGSSEALDVISSTNFNV